MAENVWVLQDGRSILVEFETPATAWTNHAWDRAAQYVMAAEVGGAVNYADSLSAGAYSLSGKTLSDSVVRADSLSVGSYLISGKSITDLLAKNDSLSVGNYAVSGKAITDVVNRNDGLSVGNYSVSGKTITDVVTTGGISYTDNLSVGAYLYSGIALVDEVVSSIQIGSGGYFAYHQKKLRKKLEYEEQKAKEAYQELLESAPVSIKKQAISIVKQFSETKKKTPPVSSIDWIALEHEKIRVNALLALWQEQIDIEREDEEILLLM